MYYVGKATMSIMESDFRYRAASLCGPVLHEEKDGSNPDENPGSLFYRSSLHRVRGDRKMYGIFSRAGQALREKGYCILPGILWLKLRSS
jgi:hypothetical protein